MAEVLALYSSVGPVERGLIFFLFGLVVGSFTAALQYRVAHPHRLSGHRSCCPECRKTLAVLDLIPVLSYLALRGKCRYCSTRIAPTYPLVEATCAASAGLAGWGGGWAAGGAVLVVWVVGAYVTGWLSRRLPDGQRGFTLVEVLVASLLLAFVAGSVLQVVNVSRRNSLAAHQRTLATGLAREAMAQAAEQIRRTSGPAASGTITHPVYSQYEITVASHDPKPTLVGRCYVITVVVNCPNCTVGSGSTVSTTGVVCK